MKLYLLVSNGGDGSYSINYCLDPLKIQELQKKYDDGECDYEYDPGIDGDGFHYDTIEVPDGSTPESLGLSKYSMLENDE